jgi:hypothetical protein
MNHLMTLAELVKKTGRSRQLCRLHCQAGKIPTTPANYDDLDWREARIFGQEAVEYITAIQKRARGHNRPKGSVREGKAPEASKGSE